MLFTYLYGRILYVNENLMMINMYQALGVLSLSLKLYLCYNILIKNIIELYFVVSNFLYVILRVIIYFEVEKNL